MATHGIHHGFGPFARLVLLIVLSGTVMGRPALGQAKKNADKAASAFDDDKKSGDEKKPGETKDATVSDRDTIGFSQQNAASQMNELEDRMFRLSEALRGLEPENASRLRLALKFSREEQILEQMRETFKLLKDAQLSKAETETKELIAKLEHLRNLLLAEDLDFQLKLARLRRDARNDGPARPGPQGRAVRTRLVALRLGAAEATGEHRHPPARTRRGSTRPASRDRRHQEPVPRRQRGSERRPGGDRRSRGETSAPRRPRWRPTPCSRTCSRRTFSAP